MARDHHHFRRARVRDFRRSAQRLSRVLAAGRAVVRRAAVQFRGRFDRLRRLHHRHVIRDRQRASRASPDRGDRADRDSVCVQSHRRAGRGLAHGRNRRLRNPARIAAVSLAGFHRPDLDPVRHFRGDPRGAHHDRPQPPAAVGQRPRGPVHQRRDRRADAAHRELRAAGGHANRRDRGRRSGGGVGASRPLGDRLCRDRASARRSGRTPADLCRDLG